MARAYYVGDFGQKLTVVLTDICPTCAGTGRVGAATCPTCLGVGRVAYDLTGYAVTFIFQKPDGTVVTEDGVVEAPATDGHAFYTWEDGDLDLDGRWFAMLRAVTPVPPAAATRRTHGEFEFFVRRVPA